MQLALERKYMTLPSPRETFRLRGVFYRMFEDRVQALPVRDFLLPVGRRAGTGRLTQLLEKVEVLEFVKQ